MSPLVGPPAAAAPPQGCCTVEPCPYLHVNLPPAAPVCTRFLRGYCPAGVVCPHKHYTLRMVRDEKRLHAAAGHAAAAAVGGRSGARGGGGKRKEQAGGGRRYFDASSADSSAAGSKRQAGPAAGPEQPEYKGQEGEAEGPPGAKRRRQDGGDTAEAQRRVSDSLKPAFLLGDFVPL